MNAAASIRDFISSTFFVDGYSDGDSFLAGGVLDSMGVLELVMFVESTFEVTIEDDELIPENLDSIDRLTAFLQRKANVTQDG